MKTFLKTLAVGLFALTMLVTAGSVASADEATKAEFQAKVAELRETHSELKAQVEAGEITKEEARETWKGLISEVREEKKERFEMHKEKMQDKYETLLEENPEKAEMLKERMDAMEDRRAQHEEKRAEVKAQVEAGEITKEEAHEMKKDAMKERKEAHEAFKAENPRPQRGEKGMKKMPAPAPAE